MMRAGSRDAEAALALIDAAMYGHMVQRVTKARPRSPNSSPLSALANNDSATEIKHKGKIIKNAIFLISFH